VLLGEGSEGEKGEFAIELTPFEHITAKWKSDPPLPEIAMVRRLSSE
jgi:hypothetical protein